MEDTEYAKDIREKLIAENKRLKKESALKTAWLSLISHDFIGVFNNLLQVIEAMEQESISNIDFFKLLPDLKRDIQKNLQTITDTGHWIKTQSDHFKLRRSEIIAVELYSRLKLKFKKELAGKNLTLAFEGNESILVYTDRILMEFILNKIFDNAIKYSFPGGTIIFTVTESNRFTIIEIRDLGIGMDQKQLDNIFSFDSPTFRGTAGETGAGLSLILIKKFVHLLEGNIEIKSTLRKGTNVFIHLRKNEN